MVSHLLISTLTPTWYLYTYTIANVHDITSLHLLFNMSCMPASNYEVYFEIVILTHMEGYMKRHIYIHLPSIQVEHAKSNTLKSCTMNTYIHGFSINIMCGFWVIHQPKLWTFVAFAYKLLTKNVLWCIIIPFQMLTKELLKSYQSSNLKWWFKSHVPSKV